MNTIFKQAIRLLVVAAILTACLPGSAGAMITGITGVRDDTAMTVTYKLIAMEGHIVTGDGGTIYMWGLADGQAANPAMQYVGPTLIVPQGYTIKVNFENQLKVASSLNFPGHIVSAGIVSDNPATPAPKNGFISLEAYPRDVVQYSFVASEPGTYYYQSGTDPAMQVEMGLIGALIVRPTGFNPDYEFQTDGTNTSMVLVPKATRRAYNSPDSEYDHEILYLNTEIDHRIHEAVESNIHDPANAALPYMTPQQAYIGVDNSSWFPFYWLYNGRTALDTLAADNVPWLPNQPYGTVPRIHPGEKMLLRIIGGGRDMHPLHHHGNSSQVIARDGRLLGLTGAEYAEGRFTVSVTPGHTQDVIFDPWYGDQMGWDVYGHTIDTPMTYPNEKPFAQSTLGNDLAAADPELTIAPVVAGEQFPTARIFRAVLWSGGTGVHDATSREVVTLRKIGVDNTRFMVVKRGLEGTLNAPATWTAGVNVAGTYHGMPFPVTLPDQKDLLLGAFYSGSPFLGSMGNLPPGEGGFNLNNGIAFMWHSHNEKELTNNNIFPGGALSIMLIEPPFAAIPTNNY